MKIVTFISLIAILTFSSCNSQNKNYQTIAPKEFSIKIASQANAQILDVRTTEEYNECHLENAKNINWNSEDFVKNVEKLDKSKPILVYCKLGGRSAKASDKLVELGFKNIINLEGGIINWTNSGLPTKK